MKYPGEEKWRAQHSPKQQQKKRKNISKATVKIAGVKLSTAQSIADAFGVNVITILRHIKKGRLIARLVGHKYYVTEKNLRIFLNMPKKK